MVINFDSYLLSKINVKRDRHDSIIKTSNKMCNVQIYGIKGVVSKETVVLHTHSICSDEGLRLEMSAFRIPVQWSIYIINSVDKTKLLYTNIRFQVSKFAH